MTHDFGTPIDSAWGIETDAEGVPSGRPHPVARGPRPPRCGGGKSWDRSGRRSRTAASEGRGGARSPAVGVTAAVAIGARGSIWPCTPAFPGSVGATPASVVGTQHQREGFGHEVHVSNCAGRLRRHVVDRPRRRAGARPRMRQREQAASSRNSACLRPHGQRRGAPPGWQSGWPMGSSIPIRERDSTDLSVSITTATETWTSQPISSAPTTRFHCSHSSTAPPAAASRT